MTKKSVKSPANNAFEAVVKKNGSLAEQVRTARTARTALGWSQTRLVEKAHISLSTLRDIEAGRRTNPSIITLWKLAKAMGITISKLLK